MTLALVFAMAGGAYAAGKFVITSTKQIKPSVLAQLKGKVGLAGAQGVAGPQGPVGANGKDGLPGKDGGEGKEGPVGKEGPEGKEGVSVTATQSASTIEGTHCVGVGGSKFVSASGNTYACNGKEGKEGKEGSPWTAGGTLPSGKSEMGAWAAPAANATETSSSFVFGEISFTVPLSVEPAVTVVTTAEVEGKTVPAACTVENVEGSAGNPLAAPGNLCVYEGPSFLRHGILSSSTFKPGGGAGASKFGALVIVSSNEAQTSGSFGSWAVTAP
jgi:hypothetical protein